MPIASDIKEYQTVPLCQIISNLYIKSVLLKDRQLKYWENMNTELGQFRSPTILSPRVGSYQFEMKNINSSDFSLYPTMTIIVKDKFLLLMYLMKRKMGILIGTNNPLTAVLFTNIYNPQLLIICLKTEMETGLWIWTSKIIHAQMLFLISPKLFEALTVTVVLLFFFWKINVKPNILVVYYALLSSYNKTSYTDQKIK